MGFNSGFKGLIKKEMTCLRSVIIMTSTHQKYYMDNKTDELYVDRDT